MDNTTVFVKAVMYDLVMECVDAQWTVRGMLANVSLREGFIHLARKTSEPTLLTLRFDIDPDQPTGGARVRLKEVSLMVDPDDQVLTDLVKALVRDIKARVRKLNADEWSTF